jgi:nucleoside-diphosphate-sugar epimerase
VSTILVTGGNGFVGRHVVRALLDRGDVVRVLALPGEDTSWLTERGVAVYHVDVWRPIRDYRAVNVTGTGNIGRAALAGHVRRFVHMSSSSVYGVALGRPADESFPLAPFPDPYPVSKAEGDLVVQRMIARDGLPAVIIRPDQIFGPGDHLHYGRMADRLRSGRGIVVGSGDNAMPLVFVTDVVQGLLLALDRDRAVGRAYNIGSGRLLTQRQVLEAIARDIGAGPPRFRLPYRALYAAGYLAERLATLAPSLSRPPVTRLGVAFFGTDNRYPIDKARRELGYRPQVDLRDGLRITAMWYCRHDRPGPGATAAGRPAEGVAI